MTTRIKDLKSMAAGTVIEGMPLMIKRARKAYRDAEGKPFQEVVFMDCTGEMPGLILLDDAKNTTQSHSTTGVSTVWKSKTNICIMYGVLQDTDERKKEGVKLVVHDCFDAATPLGYDQSQDLQAEDWKQLREDEIKGKIRHGLVCAFIQSNQIEPDMTSGQEHIPKFAKAIINEIVDYIMTGE